MGEKRVIYVEHITEGKDMTIGRSASLPISHKNLFLIYKTDLMGNFRDETYKNGVFRFFDKYCQFIFSVETIVIPNFSIILTFVDCNNNVDAALEFYTAKGTNLKDIEKTKFMKLFTEIQNLPASEYAEMEIMAI